VPVSGVVEAGRPPGEDEIAAKLDSVNTCPAECGGPPWRFANDPDPDRQQARRVLRWLTGRPTLFCCSIQQAHGWVTGENLKPPANHDGRGGYDPCPSHPR